MITTRDCRPRLSPSATRRSTVTFCPGRYVLRSVVRPTFNKNGSEETTSSLEVDTTGPSSPRMRAPLRSPTTRRLTLRV